MIRYCALLIIGILLATAPVFPQKAKPVFRKIYAVENNHFYRTQARLWENTIRNDPQNTEAWYSYFLANHYCNDLIPKEKSRKLSDILDRMAVHIPDTYEYHYLRYFYDQSALNNLEKAFKIDTARAEALYDYISLYEIKGSLSERKDFCARLYQSGDIIPGLLDYNFNMLQSVAPNSLLFTNGDNDTYPAWVLQDVKNIRPDITVLNIHMIFYDRDYLQRIFAGKKIDLNAHTINRKNTGLFLQELLNRLYTEYPYLPLFIAVTINEKDLKKVRNSLYLTGLAYRYSPKRFDNLAVIRENVETRWRLDNIDVPLYSDLFPRRTAVSQLNLNYVASAVKLKEYYTAKNKHEQAKDWFDLARKIAKRAQNKKMIQYLDEIK